MNRRVVFFVALVLILDASNSFCRTWYVEKNGTGEFVSIHNAMIASSAGDTIMIGPGRYDDFHPLVAPAWTREVIVIVTKDNLTLIGSGTDVTIIGPVVRNETSGLQPMSVATIANISAKIENLAIENTYNGIYWVGDGGRIEVDGCRFSGYSNGFALLSPGGALIKNSTFESDESFATGVAAHPPCGPINIVDCSFFGPDVNEAGISVSGILDVVVEECNFDLNKGLTSYGSNCVVENCVASESTGVAVISDEGSQVYLENNQLYGYFTCLDVGSGSSIVGTGNSFSGGKELAVIYIHTQSRVELSGNHILKTGNFAVLTRWFFSGSYIQDLTDNYWGTTDTDSIAMSILEENDGPPIRSVVQYLPIANSPVPTKSSNWGSVKSMFR